MIFHDQNGQHSKRSGYVPDGVAKWNGKNCIMVGMKFQNVTEDLLRN
jgi:hypothetical protein